MTDAYKCDRCGSFEAKPVALQVGANGDGGGRITVNKEEGRIRQSDPGFRSVDDTNCTIDILGGDLCEKCGDEFAEFWEGDAE